MLKTSETYFLSVDIFEDDDMTIQVLERGPGGRFAIVQSFIGQEAKDIYNKLIKGE